MRRSHPARAYAFVCLSAAILTGLVQASGAAQTDVPVLTWREASPLERGRDHHAVFLVESGESGLLYVAGGTDYSSVFDDVWFTHIEPNGATGPWGSAPPLPEPRAGLAVVVAGGLAVAIGGQRPGRENVADVDVAAIDSDGSLDDWAPASPLPTPRFHHAAAVYEDRIYVTGGQGAEGTSTATVFLGRVDDAARAVEWEELRRLPRPRSHHASFVHDGALYVLGGLDGAPGGGPALLTDVLRAPIQPDGSLGDWQLVSLMPHSYATHSAFVHAGYVWVLGGVEDNFRFVDSIWRAPLQEDGGLGAWEGVEPGLPAARAHVHVTPVLNGRVYSVGGSKSRQVTGALYVGEFMEE